MIHQIPQYYYIILYYKLTTVINGTYPKGVKRQYDSYLLQFLMYGLFLLLYIFMYFSVSFNLHVSSPVLDNMIEALDQEPETYGYSPSKVLLHE